MKICIFSLIISLGIAHADIVSTKSWHKRVPQGIEDLVAIQERLRYLLPQTKAALVSIEAMDGAGSGVIVSEDGLVLTAAHVIGTTGKKMFVRLPDGKRAKLLKRRNGLSFKWLPQTPPKWGIGALVLGIREGLTRKEE